MIEQLDSLIHRHVHVLFPHIGYYNMLNRHSGAIQCFLEDDFLNRESVLITQSRPTLCDPIGCSPPGSSLHGILQVRTLEGVVVVQFLSHVRLFVTHGLQHARPPCPSPRQGVYSWSLLKLSIKSVMPSNHLILCCPLLLLLQSFPASGTFQMSQFFTSGDQSIGVSASTSVLPMILSYFTGNLIAFWPQIPENLFEFYRLDYFLILCFYLKLWNTHVLF